MVQSLQRSTQIAISNYARQLTGFIDNIHRSKPAIADCLHDLQPRRSQLDGWIGHLLCSECVNTRFLDRRDKLTARERLADPEEQRRSVGAKLRFQRRAADFVVQRCGHARRNRRTERVLYFELGCAVDGIGLANCGKRLVENAAIELGKCVSSDGHS